MRFSFALKGPSDLANSIGVSFRSIEKFTGAVFLDQFCSVISGQFADAFIAVDNRTPFNLSISNHKISASWKKKLNIYNVIESNQSMLLQLTYVTTGPLTRVIVTKGRHTYQK